MIDSILLILVGVVSGIFNFIILKFLYNKIKKENEEFEAQETVKKSSFFSKSLDFTYTHRGTPISRLEPKYQITQHHHCQNVIPVSSSPDLLTAIVAGEIINEAIYSQYNHHSHSDSDSSSYDICDNDSSSYCDSEW
jgi:hypothetical protein